MSLRHKGFTLIELLVVMSIIAIFSAIGYANFSDARKISRDAQRQSDLRLLQSAIELYKQKYGVYPAPCNGFATNINTPYSGQKGTSLQCSDGSNEYIVGLAPEFIPVLPNDPNPKSFNGGDLGYLYITNSERSVYKITTSSVEVDVVDQNSEFFRCGTDYKLGSAFGFPWKDPAMCARIPTRASGNRTNYLTNYDTTGNQCKPVTSEGKAVGIYALSGGYSSNTSLNPGYPERSMEYDTEIVRCK
jgi:prepilin-type N-terminal cleavage/methylation domain-containing protein